MYESGKKWAWHDNTLYLTQSERSYKSTKFDQSLEDIFKLLHIRVEKVTLAHYNTDISLIHNIKTKIKMAKILDLERSIETKVRDLGKLKSEVKDVEEEIMDLHSELDVIRTSQ